MYIPSSSDKEEVTKKHHSTLRLSTGGNVGSVVGVAGSGEQVSKGGKLPTEPSTTVRFHRVASRLILISPKPEGLLVCLVFAFPFGAVRFHFSLSLDCIITGFIFIVDLEIVILALNISKLPLLSLSVFTILCNR